MQLANLKNYWPWEENIVPWKGFLHDAMPSFNRKILTCQAMRPLSQTLLAQAVPSQHDQHITENSWLKTACTPFLMESLLFIWFITPKLKRAYLLQPSGKTGVSATFKYMDKQFIDPLGSISILLQGGGKWLLHTVLNIKKLTGERDRHCAG